MLAADRVDSTTGVQMAYLKQWAPRAERLLESRVPELTAGPGTACTATRASSRARSDRSTSRISIRPTTITGTPRTITLGDVVADDQPDSYGVARKRVDLRSPDGRSVFKRSPFDARHARESDCDGCCELVVLSYNDESWISLDELVDMCAVRGEVRIVAFESKRYVGRSQIGIHNPSGVKVGTPGRLRNQEYVLVCGDLPAVV